MRRKMNMKKSKRLFTATAMKTNKRNIAPTNPRGGYRL